MGTNLPALCTQSDVVEAVVATQLTQADQKKFGVVGTTIRGPSSKFLQHTPLLLLLLLPSLLLLREPGCSFSILTAGSASDIHPVTLPSPKIEGRIPDLA